ncbi:MAG: hypothetical protein COV67_11825 [Nitrospinae bacterium CG11_big_fil_rev_8_21_14_0_20_56_8]|nr:MAG: hypothetical protein COV67_11825 [Nitrospinae bacterium CG11_big_fil_rev_8_21_14_0_20_56_8]
MKRPHVGGKNRKWTGFLLPGLLLLAGTACDFKLPSPPPDLLYKFNVVNVGQGPACLVTADLDLDGWADLVSANTKDSTLSILYGHGDGTFDSPLSIPVPAEPTSLVVDDVNRDGFADILTNSRGAHVVTVLLGRAKRSFYPAHPIPTGKVPLALAVGHFNEDNNLDLAVTLTFDKVEIYLGTGDGSFKKGMTYGTGSRSFSVLAQDFNGDGRADLVLATTSSNASGIRLFPGNGDGTFASPRRMAQGLMPLTVIAKDMNDDGKPDLLFAAGQGDNMYLMLSNGDGAFRKEIPFSGGGGPIALVAEHFNDDALLDVAVANSRSSSFSLILRTAKGGFHYPTRDYVVDGGTPLTITSGDYNGDGMKDVAVASNFNNSVEIYLQRRILG